MEVLGEPSTGVGRGARVEHLDAPEGLSMRGKSRLHGANTIVALMMISVFASACDAATEPAVDYQVRRNTLPMVLAPGWVTGTTWPVETVVALNSIAARSTSLVDGNVAVLTAGTGSFLSGTSELSISSNAEITGSVRADGIDMVSSGHIFGTAAYNLLTGLGTIDGAKTASLTVPVPITIVATSNFTAGTTAVNVASTITTVINPGSYGAATVAAGTRTTKTILRLNTGAYNFDSIALGNFARLECVAACEIRVKNRVSVGSNSYIGPGGGGANSMTMDTVKLFVEGANGTSSPTGLPAAVSLGQRSELKAYTFVPNGTLVLGQSVSGVGKFIAKDVDIGSDTELMSGSSSQVAMVDAWVVGPTWPSELLTAWNSIDVLASTSVTGNAAVIMNNAGQYLSTSPAVIGANTVLTGGVRADKVELAAGSTVSGAVSYNTLVNAGSAGSLVTPLTMPLDVRVPVFPLITTGSSDYTLPANVSLTLAAGRFRDVTLSAGTSSARSVLTLSGGVYEMRSLTFGNYSSILCAAACEIRVKNTITPGDYSVLGPASGLDSSKVKVFVLGKSPTPNKTPFPVSFGANSTIDAFMAVYRGTLEVKSGVTLRGRFVARDIRLGSSTVSQQAGVTLLAPVIQTQPVGLTVVQGQSATFSVSATGSDITFQWKRNGVAIAGATTGLYTTASTVLADTGVSFSVTITNSVGTITSNAALLTVNSCSTTTNPTIATACGIGACARTGTQSCVDGNLVNTCTAGAPAASDATCDGIDDNCNGRVDDGYVPVATTCALGACASSGATSCVAGVVKDSCTSTVPAASDTTCNGIDDNCNGQIDEGFVSYGSSCGTGVCARTGTVSCVGGAPRDSCNPGAPTVGIDSDTTCNGIDEDCDGAPDDDYISTSTSCGIGACSATGATNCVAGVVVNSCRAGTNAPNDVTCDGIDDNCNGTKDEGYVSTATTCGVGACGSTGATSCVSGTLQNSCAPGAPAASDTTCNNIDDNCNGTKDEGYVSTATTCGVGACGASGTMTCVAGAVQNSCTPGTPTATDATCNNVDDNCNGTKDEGYVTTSTTCGVGACGASGAMTCVSGAVQNSCTPGTPAASDTTCNNVDDNCNGTKDEGYVSVATSCGSDTCTGSGATRCVGGAVQNSCVVPCDSPALVGITAGGEHSCAMLDTSQVTCWGGNIDGQLGNGSNSEAYKPVLVSGLTGVLDVVAGHAHTCALMATGAVRCWGRNANGQLGNGSKVKSNLPSLVSGVSDATELATGLAHTCALRATGEVVCWGDNSSGQLGNGTIVEAVTPVLVSGLTDAVHVAAGYGHTCALRATGAVACWGANWNGQLGNGSLVDARTPVVAAGVTNATQLATGVLHTCAVNGSGSVKCWGANTYGQLGDGSKTDSPTPVTVLNVANAVHIAAGQLHSCAVRQTGEMSCWGYNAYGELGDGSLKESATARDVVGVLDAVAVATGDLHTCALLTSKKVQCWGDGAKGQLGHGASAIMRSPTPVVQLTDATAVVTSSYNTCALRGTGAVSCWGTNSSGELGNGTGEEASSPMAVASITNATALAAGDAHTCALRGSGSISCWGYGFDGELGNGLFTNASTPVAVAGISNAVAVAAGVSHTCAVHSAGAVSCWGYGGDGQLGQGALTDSALPVSVIGISNAVAISVGVAHSCAVLATGSVQCWGEGDFGRLGRGSIVDSSTPVAVTGITNAVQVAAGDYHNCALLSTGAIRCWGRNSNSQLGDGSAAIATTPVATVGISTATAVSAGTRHSCARLSSGAMLCWGANETGQLGDGTTVQRTTATSVSGITDAVTIGTGLAHSCATRATGEVLCWGDASSGRLGNGSPWSSVPVRLSWSP